MSQDTLRDDLRNTSSQPVCDILAVEDRLRSDLAAALARLKSARTAIERAATNTDLDISAFQSAAEQRIQALAAVETASSRLARFVLDGVIPVEMRELAGEDLR